MGVYGYNWTPYEFETEDGFTLTLMNVDGKKDKYDELWRIPTLVFPPSGLAPDQEFNVFMSIPDGQVPPQFKFYDSEQLDMWFLYPRFTKYASGPYPKDGPEYWDFTMDDLGRKDLKAAVDYIYNVR